MNRMIKIEFSEQVMYETETRVEIAKKGKDRDKGITEREVMDRMN